MCELETRFKICLQTEMDKHNLEHPIESLLRQAGHLCAIIHGDEITNDEINDEDITNICRAVVETQIIFNKM